MDQINTEVNNAILKRFAKRKNKLLKYLMNILKWYLNLNTNQYMEEDLK